MNGKKLLKNITSSFVLQIISLLYGFIVPILIIKYFGSETNGLVSSISRFLAYIVLLEAGIGPVIKNALFKPLVEKDKNLIDDILGTTNRFFRYIAFAFVIYIIVLCLIYPVTISSNEYSHWYIISLIIAIAISRFFEYFIGMTYKLFLQSDSKNYIINYIYIVTYLLDIIIIYILIINKNSIQFIKIICSLIYLSRPMLMRYYFMKKYSYRINKKSNYKLSKKWDALAHHIAATVQDNTDVVVLTFLDSLTNVSIYSIYSLVMTGIKSIIYSLINGLDSFFGKMLVTEESGKIKSKFETYNFLFYTVSTIIFGCTIVLIVPFVEIYTKSIHDANYIHPLFAYLMIFAEFNFIIRYPYSTITFAKGHFKETRWFSILEPIVNISLSIIFVKKYGIIGVALGTLISMLIRSFGFIVYSTKVILQMQLLKNFKMIILSYTELIIILLVRVFVIDFSVNNYLEWFLIAIITFILIAIIVCMINSIFCKEKIKVIIERLKKIKSKRGKNEKK